MLLAIDVGNTETVVGVFVASVPDDGPRDPGELAGLLHHWRISTRLDRTVDEHALLLRELLSSAGLAFPGDKEAASAESMIDGAVLSSSVPPMTPKLREMVERW